MTETDATVQPLQMPVKFLPYLEKYRIYKIFKVKSNLHIGKYDSTLVYPSPFWREITLKTSDESLVSKYIP